MFDLIKIYFRFIRKFLGILFLLVSLTGVFFLFTGQIDTSTFSSFMSEIGAILFSFIISYLLLRKKVVEKPTKEETNKVRTVSTPIVEESNASNQSNYKNEIIMKKPILTESDDSFSTELMSQDLYFKYTESDPDNSDIGDQEFLQEAGKYKLLDYVKGKTTNISYPAYFTHRYMLEDPRQIHQDFINSGYLVEASNKDKLSTLTVKELKEILRLKNLKVSGNKSELINRLDSNGYIAKIDSVYTLSDRGLKTVEENKPWLDFHKNNYPMSARNFKEAWEFTGLENGDHIAYTYIMYKMNLYKSNNILRQFSSLLDSMIDILDRNKKWEQATKFSIISTVLGLTGYGEFYDFSHLSLFAINYINKHSNYYSKKLVREVYNEYAPKKNTKMYLDDVIKYIELALNDFYIAENELNKRNKDIFDDLDFL